MARTELFERMLAEGAEGVAYEVMRGAGHELSCPETPVSQTICEARWLRDRRTRECRAMIGRMTEQLIRSEKRCD
jgi:hypothetical protein